MAITPLASYQAAINYNSENKNTEHKPDDQIASFKKIITRMNNSMYIYPTVSVLLFTISTIFIVFSKSINVLYKIFSVLLLFIYIAITVYWFKK